MTGPDKVSKTISDIRTDKKSDEQCLRLADAIEQIGEAVSITDVDGNILYINPAFERITGYAREEVLGRNHRILKSGRQNRKFYEEMWGAVTAGKTWSGELINKRKDGTLYYDR